MQAAQQSQPAPLGVVYDTSLDRIDQILALPMLFNLQGARTIRVASLSTSRFSLPNAAFLDAVARFYSTGMAQGYRPNSIMLPVGMASTGPESDAAPAMISAVLTRAATEGGPAYPHGMTHVNETSVAGPLIRNALTAYHDENAAVVLAGLPANLLSVLALSNGPEWASRKARVLSVVGGRFDGGGTDPTVAADVAGFRKLLAEWPTPVVMVGAELNEVLAFPASALERIAAWAPDHPIVEAYRAYRPMPYDAPSQALAAVLYAAAPEEGYFEVSEPGTVTVLDDGRTQFTPSSGGRHRYLTLKPDQKDRVLETYGKLVTEQPPNLR